MNYFRSNLDQTTVIPEWFLRLEDTFLARLDQEQGKLWHHKLWCEINPELDFEKLGRTLFIFFLESALEAFKNNKENPDIFDHLACTVSFAAGWHTRTLSWKDSWACAAADELIKMDLSAANLIANKLSELCGAREK